MGTVLPGASGAGAPLTAVSRGDEITAGIDILRRMPTDRLSDGDDAVVERDVNADGEAKGDEYEDVREDVVKGGCKVLEVNDPAAPVKGVMAVCTSSDPR